MRILLVDDDDKVRETTKELLQSTGHTITEAKDGLAATALLGLDTGFDLIITDMVMPNVDGVALSRYSKVQNPERPVILISGTPEPTQFSHSLADDFLAKPYSPAQLFSLAQKYEPVTIQKMRMLLARVGLVAGSGELSAQRKWEMALVRGLSQILCDEMGVGKGDLDAVPDLKRLGLASKRIYFELMSAFT